VNGQALHFYLAGINNQNFLMRDKETGTWWQQITGKAVYGPMRGAQLDAVLSDELTFGEWKSEVSNGKVLAPVAKYTKKYDSKWEEEVAKDPVVISFPGTELKSRDVVVGLEVDGVSRAYPWETLVKQSPVVDRVHGTPLLVVVGADGKSFRVFVSRIDGKDAEFFLTGENPGVLPASAADNEKGTSVNSHPASSGKTDDSNARAASASSWSLLDTTTASQWNFQGCAISGSAQGKCLERVYALKDFWFDWRNYHPDTSIYKH
jgi:hypothetical protein